MTPLTRAAVDAASQAYGVPTHIILSPSRQRDHFIARWIAIRLMRQAGMSTVKIGREIGRDHTTIMSALKHKSFEGVRVESALGRAAVMFSERCSLVLGKIVYEHPIGPPRCPRGRPKADRIVPWSEKTPEQKWAALHTSGRFENVTVRRFDGSHVPEMSMEAAKHMREI